jgi:hypothetical protein
VGVSYDPNIDAINVVRDDESVILFTPQYDSTTKTLETGAIPRVELLIELTRPSRIISDPSYVRGYIRQIRRNTGSTPLPFDHAVLAAWGDEGQALVNRINDGDIEVGGEVRITNEITDCDVDPQHDWSGAYAGVGGDYHFLNGGAYTEPGNNDARVQNSRTVIAYNSTYVFFVVVDAFDPGVSMGMTIRELSDWMEGTLGATDAVSLDSGGSSTMVVNGAVVNNTTCNYTRQCGTQNATESDLPTETPPIPEVPYIEWSVDDVQPLVGNGMMMVVVEPMGRSGSFRAGQTMTVLQQTSLRLGPGSNYATLITLNPGAQGILQDHSINGVRAKGYNWWKVAFGEYMGWVRQDHLQGGPLPPPTGDNLEYVPLLHGSALPEFIRNGSTGTFDSFLQPFASLLTGFKQ